MKMLLSLNRETRLVALQITTGKDYSRLQYSLVFHVFRVNTEANGKYGQGHKGCPQRRRVINM